MISAGAISSARGFTASSSAAVSTRLGTMWAYGSPGATSPSKLRNTGREMSPVPESEIFIARIGCRLGGDCRPDPERLEHPPHPGREREGPLVVGHREWPAIDQRHPDILLEAGQRQHLAQPDRAATHYYDVIGRVGHRLTSLLRLLWRGPTA